ncbi:pantoate--beta-alanine ligase [Desulfopila inferna]|uniref:pantoate--beta-alanine ligase n=1 Tax=Desulfopila inferna TaxID=468528 RepID=UPI001965F477|nr:pantoate--beta-alanine ligase [Desulfopila inferna]
MIIVKNASHLAPQISQWKREGKTIGLVPTMGFFHAGHLALMQEAGKQCNKTVVSIFVNPRQFGPGEDLEKYPRSFDRDAQLAKEAGVDLLFAPTPEEMYPRGYQTSISVQNLSKGLCGQSRPGHFDGVATVVAKLFNLVQPDTAVFGEKDFQQLALLRQMNADLNFGVDIIGHPIVREKDGLAMSSRNQYLDRDERKTAVCLYKALQHGIKKIAESQRIPVVKLIEELQDIVNEGQGCRADYIAVVDPATLESQEVAQKGALVALAVFINDKVRLIDNAIL